MFLSHFSVPPLWLILNSEQNTLYCVQDMTTYYWYSCADSGCTHLKHTTIDLHHLLQYPVPAVPFAVLVTVIIKHIIVVE